MPNRRKDFVEQRHLVGHTQASLADALGISARTVSAWERGQNVPNVRLRQAVAKALQVGPDQLATMLQLKPEGARVPRWMSHYESLVASAGRLTSVTLNAVPGLLQTRPYAAAVESRAGLRRSEAERAASVDWRLTRQEALHRTDGAALRLQVLLAENVLWDRLAGPEVMGEQLDHLAEMSRKPNVDIRLIQQDGLATAAVSAFELLSRPEEAHPYLIVTFDPGGARYYEAENEIDVFLTKYRYLRDQSMSRTATSEYLGALADFHRRSYRNQWRKVSECPNCTPMAKGQ